MTAPAHCVLEGTTGVVPRWPDDACNDLGGLNFQDDATDPPFPDQTPSALDFKQIEMLLQRAMRMLPALSIDAILSSVTQSFIGRRSVVDAFNGSSGVTLSRTGTGLYRVEFTAGKLPPRKLVARVVSCYPATLKAAAAIQGVANQIDISVRDNSGALVDTQAILSIDIFGEGT